MNYGFIHYLYYMEKEIKKQVGKHLLTIEPNGNGGGVVRIENGMAIGFPPKKAGLDIILHAVLIGKFDEYIEFLKK